MGHISHIDYRRHDIRSSPIRISSSQWVSRIDVTWPAITSEYLNSDEHYQSLSEAHKAGVELGRRLIDKAILAQFNH